MKTVLLACPVDLEREGVVGEIERRGATHLAPEVSPSGFDAYELSGVRLLIVTVGQTNSLAASAVQAALKSAKEVGLAILVGTCGGIKDLVVGDVVVPDYTHFIRGWKQGVGSVGFKSVETLKASQALVGFAREKTKRPFVVSTAPIVSQDTLIADENDPRLTAIRGAYTDAVAIEMEAGGFFDGVRNSDYQGGVLVVRSVMDTISDRHSNDKDANQLRAIVNASQVAIDLASQWAAQSLPVPVSPTVQVVPSSTRSQIREKAIQFASQWNTATSEVSDRQTFWNEFFEIFGIRRRNVANFEKRAKRVSTGGVGAIDLLYPGRMGVEHKSRGGDLTKALDQLEDYAPTLPSSEQPALLVACDFATFRWKHVPSGLTGEFVLSELPQNLHYFEWIAGYEAPWDSPTTEIDANLDATALLAQIYDELVKSKYPAHDTRVFLTRLLFCFFADDTDVWERAAFAAWFPAETKEDGSDVGEKLTRLFGTLDLPNDSRKNLPDQLTIFPYINGGLFRELIRQPNCNREIREAIIAAGHFNWARISPSVFGSMFQNVMAPKERRQLGAHYTTERNILRTIGPLFLDDLTERINKARNRSDLDLIHIALSEITLLDPACGCGNFLLTAYRELRRLEYRIFERQMEVGTKTQKNMASGQRVTDISQICKVNVHQLWGIELEEFPALIARTAIYLADHIANNEVSLLVGDHYTRFPITEEPRIVVGNALTIDWQTTFPSPASFVFGNPPFVGMSKMNEQQRSDAVSVFSKTPASRSGRLDYVASWYAKSIDYGNWNQSTRFAFVSTNSITQGEQARTLGPFLDEHGYTIDFAHRTFAWQSEAKGEAHVHVVIIGFSKASAGKASKTLFSYPALKGEPESSSASRINWYLVEGPDLFIHKRKRPFDPSLPTGTQGSKPWDGSGDDSQPEGPQPGLVVSAAEYPEVARDPIAGKFLRRYMQATEMLYARERWCLWLPESSAEERRNSPVLRERLRNVHDSRARSGTASVREQARIPHLFAQIRQPVTNYFALPEVSSENRRYIPGMFLTPEVIAGNKLVVFPNADLWIAGFLQSSMFTTWVHTVAGRMKSDISISPGLAYFTFPFPERTPRNDQLVSDAMGNVLSVRSDLGDSLAALYDPTSTDPVLLVAHKDLDRAVDIAMSPTGSKTGRRRMADSDRLPVLFERYVELSNTEQLIQLTTNSKNNPKARRKTPRQG